MSQIALKEYLSHIEALLDENLLAEASAHCHFILQQYPRHVDTYRTLGRALLEQQYYREAIDIFYRVLGADPEDLIARAGLALALRENGEVEKAIWHMDRAFEIDPYNAAIREELDQLYRRHNLDRRLELRRPALARMYTRGKHYHLAIAELKDLLESAPNRLDLKILMAESYYWAGQMAEAIDICADLVNHLPDCIKANAILAETWLKTGQISNAESYIQRLTALTVPTRIERDSETLLGRALSYYPIDEIPVQVLVETLDYIPAEAQEWEKAQRWAEGEAIDFDSDEGPPNWLGEMGEFSSETPIDDIDIDSDEESVQVWLDDLAELDDNFLRVEPDLAGEAVESKDIASPEDLIDFAEGGIGSAEKDDPATLKSVSDPTSTEDYIEEVENDYAPGGDDLIDVDILGEEAIKEALGPSSSGEVDKAVTSSDSFREELIRELESLSSSPEDDDWLLGDESIDAELFDSSGELLQDFEEDFLPEDEVPNWLAQEVGFSGGMEKPSDRDRSRSGNEPRLSGDLVPPFENEQSDSDWRAEINAELDWSEEFVGNMGEFSGQDSDEDSESDESINVLPEWTASLEQDSELGDTRPADEFEDHDNLNLDDIPWLDEINGTFDESEDQDKSNEDN